MLRLQVDLLAKGKADLEEDALVKFVKEQFALQVFCRAQEFCFDFRGTALRMVVCDLEVAHVHDSDSKGNSCMSSFCIHCTCDIITGGW